MQFKLDPTVPRVVLVAVILFVEAIAVNAYSILQQGRFPTPLEFMTFAVGALIQLLTFMLTFLETGTSTAPKTSSPPASS